MSDIKDQPDSCMIIAIVTLLDQQDCEGRMVAPSELRSWINKRSKRARSVPRYDSVYYLGLSSLNA